MDSVNTATGIDSVLLSEVILDDNYTGPSLLDENFTTNYPKDNNEK
jgi:hypothetical protein